MQETQILLAQIQVTVVQLSLQAVTVPALGLAWLLCVSLWVPALNPGWAVWRAWLVSFQYLVRLGVLFGLLSVVIVAIAWPALLARVGSVLGPLLALSVAIVVVVGVSAWRGMNASNTWLRGFSVLITALAYTAVMLLLVVAQSWMRSPDGTALIDGRFQVLDWVDVWLNRQFATQIMLTVLGAMAGCLPFALTVVLPEAAKGAVAQRQAFAAMGVLACIGLLALLESVVIWWPDMLLGMSSLWMGDASNLFALWVGRSALVVLLITLLAFLFIMLCDAPARGSIGLFQRLTWLCIPLWLLIWWLMDASRQGDIVAGLPVVDVVSSRADRVLAVGVVGVSVVCLGAMWLFWRLCRRDQSNAIKVMA